MNKRKRRKGTPYCERYDGFGGKPLTHFCPIHRFTAKRNGNCPVCRQPLQSAGLTGRPPKKNDDKGWENFLKLLGTFHPKGCR